MTESRRDWTRGVPVVLISVCARCGHRWYVAPAALPALRRTAVQPRPAVGDRHRGRR